MTLPAPVSWLIGRVRSRWLFYFFVVVLIVLLTSCKTTEATPGPPALTQTDERIFDEGVAEVFVTDDGETVIDVKLYGRDVMLRHRTRRLPVSFEFGGILFTVTRKRVVLIGGERII